MAEEGKRVEVRMGTFACTIEGYDDPISKLKEVMSLVQRMISETPALVDVSADVDNAEVQDALDADVEPVRVRRDDGEPTEAERVEPAPASETDADFTVAAADRADVIGDVIDDAAEPPPFSDAAWPGAGADLAGDADDPTAAADLPGGAVRDAGWPPDPASDVADARAGEVPFEPAGDAAAMPDADAGGAGDSARTTAAVPPAAPPQTADESTGSGRRLYGLGRFAAAVAGARRRKPAEVLPGTADGAAADGAAADGAAAEAAPSFGDGDWQTDLRQAVVEDTDPVVNIFADAGSEPAAPPSGADRAIAATSDDEAAAHAAPDDGPWPDQAREGRPGEMDAGDRAEDAPRQGPGTLFQLRADRVVAPDRIAGDGAMTLSAASDTYRSDTEQTDAYRPDTGRTEPFTPDTDQTDADRAVAYRPENDLPETDAAPDPHPEMPEPRRAGGAFRSLFGNRSQPAANGGASADDAGFDRTDRGNLAGDGAGFDRTAYDGAANDGAANDGTADDGSAADDEVGPNIFSADPPDIPAAPSPDVAPLRLHPDMRAGDDTAAPDPWASGRGGGSPLDDDGRGGAADIGADIDANGDDRGDGDAADIFATGPSDSLAETGQSRPGGDVTATGDDQGPPDGSTRFGSLLERLQSREDAGGVAPMGAPGETGDEAEQVTPEAAGITVTDLVELSRAATVSDMLAASAAWLTLADGKLRFSRRDVMDVFESIPGDHPRTLEARIKGYGKLVRSGSLVLIGDGQFALAQSERDRFAGLLA